MANHNIALLELLRKAGVENDIDFLREAVETLAQSLIELEASQAIGAEPYERRTERATYRNGHRSRTWDTRVGTVNLSIPKLRQGTFFPSLLEPRRRAERALVAVVQEAYVHGVSTRKVDDLVQALGMTGISKSTVSRLCSELDAEVERFRNRKLEGSYPYMWLDATYLKVREAGRVQSMALVLAVGVKASGERGILGFDLGPSEDGAFWLEFLRSLVARGLKGVQLVTSDAHEGLKQAIPAALQGASWQRCRVHFMRNLLTHVPKAAQQVVAASIRSIFIQQHRADASAQLSHVHAGLEKRFPRAAKLLVEAEEDILAYMAFPSEHWRQLYSTNPLERLNKEVKRRTDVVGIFPNRAAVIRLAGAVLAEQDDEWSVGRRYFSQESMKKLLEGEVPQRLPEPQLGRAS